MITTITVNQWVIADNAKNGENNPALCINHYEYCKCIYAEPSPGEYTVVERVWGPVIGFTQHVHEHNVVDPKDNAKKAVKVVYDPINKTPCGASCWMEVET